VKEYKRSKTETTKKNEEKRVRREQKRDGGLKKKRVEHCGLEKSF